VGLAKALVFFYLWVTQIKANIHETVRSRGKPIMAATIFDVKTIALLFSQQKGQLD
jgi:hypothetical protein